MLRFSFDFPFAPRRCFWLLSVCCSWLSRCSGGLWVCGLLLPFVPLILSVLRRSVLLLSVAPLVLCSCGFSVSPCCGFRLFRCSVAPGCCSRPFRCSCGCPVAPGCCPRPLLLLCSCGPLFRCSRLLVPVVSSVAPDTNNKKNDAQKNRKKTEKKQKKNRKKTEKKQGANKNTTRAAPATLPRFAPSFSPGCRPARF